MTSSIRFVLVLHNHQPIGNFDHVFEQAYQDSYLPFLKVFEPYEQLRIALHTSGPLIEWLSANHPEYLDRLANLVAAGRVEIVGGAYYEPILGMLPSRDRVGQIRRYIDWLQNRFGTQVQGMWVPERVWEQSMARDIASAGIRYTVLDDFHFKNSGLTDDELHGYYLTEDDGKLLRVFPGSEQLRYLIPFHDPEETIAQLGRISGEYPGSVAVFADDGEKFGTWPGTKHHVYDAGWLRRFFDLLTANSDWIETSTPTDVLRDVEPLGKIYIPESSYREMTEWALPASRQVDLQAIHHNLEDSGQWNGIAPLVRGGFWRNFKARYPESDEMYARMLLVSRRLESIQSKSDHDPASLDVIDQARMHLYRGQCNCSYWHGAFGGIYLPHLRNAIYENLILADNLLDRVEGGDDTQRLELVTDDLNLDGHRDIMVSNNKLIAFISPFSGGHLYELDVRSIRHNLLASLARRPEAYHEKVRSGPSSDDDSVASIHDRVVFKQPGLQNMITYDSHPRKSFQDHFFATEATLDAVAHGDAAELGDFVGGAYEALVDRESDEVRVKLSRTADVEGHTLNVTKQFTFAAASSVIELEYFISGLPPDQPFHFAVEMNFAGLPAGADDRYFYDAARNSLGQLGQFVDHKGVQGIGMVDEWLGIDIGISSNRPTNIWAFPIQSVSQSEGGFEAVHQSVVVMPHWLIQGDEQGNWSAKLNLSIDTALAESRQHSGEMVGIV